jgi:hypothetical protein
MQQGEKHWEIMTWIPPPCFFLLPYLAHYKNNMIIFQQPGELICEQYIKGVE